VCACPLAGEGKIFALTVGTPTIARNVSRVFLLFF
jgi:hypothetical protein